jgi:hypothetical protein
MVTEQKDVEEVKRKPCCSLIAALLQPHCSLIAASWLPHFLGAFHPSINQSINQSLCRALPMWLCHSNFRTLSLKSVPFNEKST